MEEKVKIKIPNPWAISTFILLALIFVLFFTGNVQIIGKFALLTKEQVGKNTIDYINKNLVEPGGSASLVSIEDLGSVYKILTSYKGNQIPVYVTKDGKLLFLQAFDTSQSLKVEQKEQPQEIPKSDKPEAHAFVMSYCPFGLQFLKAYVQVIELLGNKADLQVNFVDYLMHGEKELHGNNFIYCVQKVEKDKFNKYLRCFVESGDYEKCLDVSKADKTKIENCINSIDKQFNLTNLFNDKSTWSGGRFPKYPVDSDLNSRYGVRGSPTFVVNGKVVSVQRSAEAVKQAICSAFNIQPAECSQNLSATEEAPGVGKIGSTSAGSSGTCG